MVFSYMKNFLVILKNDIESFIFIKDDCYPNYDRVGSGKINVQS